MHTFYVLLFRRTAYPVSLPMGHWPSITKIITGHMSYIGVIPCVRCYKQIMLLFRCCKSQEVCCGVSSGIYELFIVSTYFLMQVITKIKGFAYYICFGSVSIIRGFLNMKIDSMSVLRWRYSTEYNVSIYHIFVKGLLSHCLSSL